MLLVLSLTFLIKNHVNTSWYFLIAGIALEREFMLVTDNTQDFSGISGLSIENWLA